jgi:septum formation protein
MKNLLLKLSERALILASASPRRKQLLEGLDLPFSIEYNDNISEDYHHETDLYLVPLHLSELKSEGFLRKLDDSEILLTADTLVLCKGEILGKPSGRENAIEILRKLSGNMHEVVTGVTIRSNKLTRSFTSITKVYFRIITEEEIVYYIDEYSPYDKAGAYGVQEWIGYVAIEKIEGSFYNVMGLPVQRLYEELNDFITQES